MRDPNGASSALHLITEQQIERFSPEFFHWKYRVVADVNNIEERLSALHDRNPALIIFHVENGVVTTRSEEPFPSDSIKYRVGVYKRFFTDVFSKYMNASCFTFGFYLEDAEVIDDEIPLFCFQKGANSKNFLLPDIDFFMYDFYDKAEFIDNISFENKLDSAIFVGATTGAELKFVNGEPQRTATMSAIRDNKVPRVASALYFKDSESVHFHLPVITQCDNDSRDFLKENGFGSGVRMTWEEQYRYKYLLSMDGNGATCSRVVAALKSNSVLLKYKSDSYLFYFNMLKPWMHFVPINDDEDVVATIKLGRDRPSLFKAISANGSAFFNEHLTKDKVYEHTTKMFRLYEMILGPSTTLAV